MVRIRIRRPAATDSDNEKPLTAGGVTFGGAKATQPTQATSQGTQDPPGRHTDADYCFASRHRTTRGIGAGGAPAAARSSHGRAELIFGSNQIVHKQLPDLRLLQGPKADRHAGLVLEPDGGGLQAARHEARV